MDTHAIDYPAILMMIGTLVVVAMVIKLAFEKAGLPDLVGYLGLGILLRLGDDRWSYLSPASHEILGFLALIGLAVLLFRIGLDSNLAGLLKQLPKASMIWVGDIAISGGIAYLASVYILGLTWTSALFIAVALSATSVGISVGAWQSCNALDSPEGEFLLDVAELDDISAVLLMALLFAILPKIHGGADEGLLRIALETSLLLAGKLFVFGMACLLFSRFVEKPLTGYFVDRESPPDPMLSVVGIGFIFAALAGLLGFSIAIGAFFVGLVFSRDPKAVKMEASFQPIYELFRPFFFIGIGLDIDPAALQQAALPGLIFLLVAIAGKLMADGLPVMYLKGGHAATLIGISMVPRAEIAMVIMSRGRALGDWAVPPQIYSAIILVCAVTCLLTPLTVRRLLSLWPPGGKS